MRRYRSTRRWVANSSEGRDSTVQIESRIGGGAVGAGAKCLVFVESVERHPSAPTRIERLAEEDSVSCANNSFLVPGIGNAQTGREPLMPGLLGIGRAITR